MSESAKQSNLSGEGAVSPKHVAIIMDGNGRWARKRGLPRVAGHRKGVDAVRRIIEFSAKSGIQMLTVFAFSSENWRRPPQEVTRLMELFVEALDKDVKDLHRNNIRFKVIGDVASLSETIQQRIERSEEMTAGNTGMVFNVALNYGGRWDIVEACRRFAYKVQAGEATADVLDEKMLDSQLSTSGSPDPDLFIRTGGEKRISNFLLWQLAYTELYFTDALWPDFDQGEYESALEWYSSRQRRFGRTGEQVETA